MKELVQLDAAVGVLHRDDSVPEFDQVLLLHCEQHLTHAFCLCLTREFDDQQIRHEQVLRYYDWLWSRLRVSVYPLICNVAGSNWTVCIPPEVNCTTATPLAQSMATIWLAGCLILMLLRSVTCNTSVTELPPTALA